MVPISIGVAEAAKLTESESARPPSIVDPKADPTMRLLDGKSHHTG